MKNNKDITLSYGIIQGIYWIGFAILGAFASPYLVEAGLSNSAIGVVLSGGSLAAALMQPAVGHKIDKSHKYTNKHVIAILSIITMITSILLSFIPNGNIISIGLLFALCYIMLQLSQPFVNALGMEYINAKYNIHFGPARAIGSLGYAVSAYVLGILTVAMGNLVVPVASAISFGLISLVLVILVPTVDKSQIISHELPEHTKNNSLYFIKKYPYFMLTLIGLVCIYYTHTVINTYALQILQTKGGNSSHVGMAAAVAAGLELIPMVAFPIIHRKISLKSLIRISCIFFTIKIFMTLLVQSVTTFMLIQVLQIGGWGTLAVAIVMYVNEVVDIKDASQGQAYAGVSMTIGTVLATLTGGRMLDVIGVNLTLVCGTIVGIIGTVIVFISTKGKAQKN